MPTLPAKGLTDKFVDKVKLPHPPDQHTYIQTMERGLALMLVVSYGGSRTFRVLTYRNGKPVSRKLGNFPQMEVKAAKEAARAYWKDPATFDAQAEIGTFKEIASNWLKRHVHGNKLRTAKEIERRLTRYVYPKWQDRKFLDIRRAQVNDLLDHIADHHGRAQADAVLSTLRSLMTWHQARDENYVSPIVRGMLRNNVKARSRILTDDELRRVWNACDDCGTFGAIVRLLLLSAQRKDKVGTLRWDDLKDGTWTIRTEEREKGTAGKIALPKSALAVIKNQPRILGNPYVFPGRGSVQLFNSFHEGKVRLDAISGVTGWTIHDLRRTARSLMARTGIRPDIAERVLGHTMRGVEGIYDRHGYDAEKTDALSRLAELIDSIVREKSSKATRKVQAKGARVLR